MFQDTNTNQSDLNFFDSNLSVFFRNQIASIHDLGIPADYRLSEIRDIAEMKISSGML